MFFWLQKRRAERRGYYTVKMKKPYLLFRIRSYPIYFSRTVGKKTLQYIPPKP